MVNEKDGYVWVRERRMGLVFRRMGWLKYEQTRTYQRSSYLIVLLRKVFPRQA